MFNICWLDIFSPAVLSAKHHILFSCDFRFTLHLVGNELVFVSTFQTFFGKIRLVLIPSSYAMVLDFCLFSSLDLHYLLWGSVRGGWGGMSLGRWGQMPALSEPAALSLSPCCPVSRCWPEEAPAQWTPQREGELGGSTAGCALPLNFQHRSVQERMSTPSSSLPHHPLHSDDKEKNAPSYRLRRSSVFYKRSQWG